MKEMQLTWFGSIPERMRCPPGFKCSVTQSLRSIRAGFKMFATITSKLAAPSEMPAIASGSPTSVVASTRCTLHRSEHPFSSTLPLVASTAIGSMSTASCTVQSGTLVTMHFQTIRLDHSKGDEPQKRVLPLLALAAMAFGSTSFCKEWLTYRRFDRVAKMSAYIQTQIGAINCPIAIDTQ